MNCAFFFSSRRRHTRFKCDWSSDVCSSDLAYHLLHQCSHPPSWGHIPLPPPCMCSMGFHPHIPGSCPCPRFHPHQSGVLSPPKVLSSPSMVHDHTFTATWRVVGGCCFYEGKGPLVTSCGEC